MNSEKEEEQDATDKAKLEVSSNMAEVSCFSDLIDGGVRYLLEPLIDGINEENII